ncbi:MAG: hypothetical protein IPH82_19580 [Chloroflexi bacterium]|nr:hypothetical protein [Chloroflexota bacterium]
MNLANHASIQSQQTLTASREPGGNPKPRTGCPKEIVISYSATDVIPPLLIDQQKLEQVLNNLISNAVKYSPLKTASPDRY